MKTMIDALLKAKVISRHQAIKAKKIQREKDYRKELERRKKRERE